MATGPLAQLVAKASETKKLGKAVVFSGVGMVLLWMTDEAKRRVKNKLGIK